MAVTHHEPDPERRSRRLMWSAVAVVIAFGLLAIAVYVSSSRSGDAKQSAEDAKTAAAAVVASNNANECRAEWLAWVQEVVDHVTNGQGAISQGVYRALKALQFKDEVALKAAILIGDAGDTEIGTWNEKILARRNVYRVLLKGQREKSHQALVMCHRGPPES